MLHLIKCFILSMKPNWVIHIWGLFCLTCSNKPIILSFIVSGYVVRSDKNALLFESASNKDSAGRTQHNKNMNYSDDCKHTWTFKPRASAGEEQVGVAEGAGAANTVGISSVIVRGVLCTPVWMWWDATSQLVAANQLMYQWAAAAAAWMKRW